MPCRYAPRKPGSKPLRLAENKHPVSEPPTQLTRKLEEGIYDMGPRSPRHHHPVILSEAPRRVIAEQPLYCAESKDLGNAEVVDTVASFLMRTCKLRKSKRRSEER